jgi:hypothetical protein
MIKDFHITPHFTFYEMTNTQQRDLLHKNREEALKYIENLKFLCENVLEPLREFLNSPIIITSGFRCPELNNRIGGSSRSYHMKGLAADFILPHTTREELFEVFNRIAFEKPVSFDQLIFEMGSWIHISTREPLNLSNRYQALTYNGSSYAIYTPKPITEVANV